MKSIVKSRNLFRVVAALIEAGETGVGYKDSAYASVATVWSDNTTGRHEEIVKTCDSNLVARASILS